MLSLIPEGKNLCPKISQLKDAKQDIKQRQVFTSSDDILEIMSQNSHEKLPVTDRDC